MRQTKAALLAWGANHNYPYLRLGETDRVRHGEGAWRRMIKDQQRRALAWQRIARWNELLGQQSA